ncbi:iron-containing alcohol dehydrogenase [Candidatus Nitrosarchaeum limnium SFB1]|uniref:Iron-containing alcohol dehydrogenase n=1 Tax=Candidatus Nitrosarchaeum limnium SFB1 TaxID=886738 RepID=F3KMW7_9ARCH|nr:iron-containing alcohol dehydrogenase [Candidatus Nitrosarchaeum limnium SFB1]
MYKIIQPSKIIFGLDSAKNFSYPFKPLIITSSGAIKREWLDHLDINDFELFDSVESNPSMETVNKIVEKFDPSSFSAIIGIGGGSVLDVAKYVGFKTVKQKIMIPTTFGSGSEVTRISVLKINGKKQSFHDDKILADIAIVDSFFIKNTPLNIIKNSVIDACAQCTEAYDSKNSNEYTKFLCEQAFNILENGILNDMFEKFPFGSLIAGLGFGNSSTTLGHALSYIYSNEGYSHGHALAHTTLVAHKFNKSKFYERFKKIVEKLKFSPIHISSSLDDASELILQDRKHLDNNPNLISKNEIIELLKEINSHNF